MYEDEYDDQEQDADDQDFDDQGDGDFEDDAPSAVAVAVAGLLADRCGIEVDDPSDDPAEFIEQLYDALQRFPGWELVDDDEDEPAPRTPKLTGRLSHRKKAVRVSRTRRMSAQRGRAVAAEILRTAALAHEPREGTARLSHRRQAGMGPMTAAEGRSVAREILSNCPFLDR